jgi:anti-sigma B factor antagonist
MAANSVPVPSKALHIDARTKKGIPILKCSGRITIETSSLLMSVVKKLVSDSEEIVLDLADVAYMDSSGLGTIVAAYVSAKCSGCDLKLINITDRVKKLFQTTKISSIFEGYGESLMS